MSVGVQSSRAQEAVVLIAPSVPTAAVHIVFLLVATGSCLLALDGRFWLTIGLLLSIGATVAPHRIAAWWLVLLLAFARLFHDPTATGAAFHVLLLGVHLLHVLGSFTRLLPFRGRIEIAGFGAPLRRFLLVQGIVQLVSMSALADFGDVRGSIAHLSVVAAAALGSAAIVLARALRSHTKRG